MLQRAEKKAVKAGGEILQKFCRSVTTVERIQVGDKAGK